MSQPEITEHAIQLAYLAATVLFVLSLRWMSAPSTARRGVRAGEIGMLIAVVATLFHHGIIDFRWIITGSSCVSR